MCPGGCLDGRGDESAADSVADDDSDEDASDPEPIDDSVTNGTDETPDDSQEGTGDTDDEEATPSTQYRIVVDEPVATTDEAVCEFDALPDDAQVEFEQTIEDEQFETDGRALLELEAPPALLDTECYAGYIEFEDKYFWTEIVVSSG